MNQCWSIWAAELLPKLNVAAKPDHIDVVLALLLVCEGNGGVVVQALCGDHDGYRPLDAMRAGESSRMICGELHAIGPVRAALQLVEFDRVHWAASEMVEAA